MNPLLRKEIRLLLPAWIAAMLLAIVPPWILPLDFGAGPIGLVQVMFSLGVLFLGITSFGQEFNSGAISNLLAQPLDRNRIWRTKTVILALAFLVVCFAACASRAQTGLIFSGRGQDTLEGLALAAIVTFSGGLWTTLLLRQMTGAFWFTLLIPAAIVMLVTAALQVSILSDSSVNRIIDISLAAYSIAGFFFARHLFLRAQDIQWTGGQITFFSREKSSESIANPVSGHPPHWLYSLLWKEIQLHQANLLIAIFLLALNIASVCILKIHPRFKNPDISYMLEAVGILWLLMPLVIGGTAVSEERRMGILESLLCLPASRGAQLSIKFLVALVLSLFLGGAMPLLMDHSDHLDFGIFAIAATIFFISFYTSSFARSTVQAIGLAIVICLMIGGLMSLQSMGFELFAQTPLGLLLLTVCLGSATLLFVFGVLIFWNFRWLHENRTLWRRNVISVLVAFAGILAFSDAIYFRAWELFLPIQPPAGPVRLRSSGQLQLPNTFNTLYFVEPDGRLWTETLAYDAYQYDKDHWMVVSREKSRNEIIGGSNWVSVTADDFQAVGVQSDGTVWSIQRMWNDKQGRWRQNTPFTRAKIGSDTDWSQAAGGGTGFLLLKKDGSLWTWGTHNYKWNHPWTTSNKLRLDRAELPARVDGDEAFAEVVSSRNQAYARKNDGTVWRWIGWNDTNYLCTLAHETNLDNQWANFAAHFSDQSQFADQSDSILGVTTNGALFLNEDIRSETTGFKPRYEVLPLGQNAKWKVAAYGPYPNIWAIRDDGTLWQWAPRWDLSRLRQAKPVQLGNRSDWVALGGNLMAGVALAADGTLWAWEQPSRHIWLAPSRKPIYVGNIFEGTDDAAPPAPRN